LSPGTGAKARRGLVLALLLFLFAAVLSTWPQAKHLSDGMTDIWDGKFTAWVLHWDFAQTFRDPLHLFDANIFHPARSALAFSENLYGAALFGFPLYAAGASTLTAYNVLFLLGMFLSGMGAWALARYVTRDEAASLLAGLIYAFNPWRLAQIPHIQFQWGAFLPLFLLFLLKYLDGGRRRDAALFSVFFAWNALANIHYALFGGMLALAVLAYEALAGGLREKKRVLSGSLLALAAASLAVLPFFLPYFWVAELYGAKRGAGEMLFFSGRPLDFLTAGAQNKLYAPLTQQWGKPEGDFFPGLVPVFFAIYALWKVKESGQRRPEASPRSPRERRTLRVLDYLLVALFLVWLWATLRPGLTLGPLKLTDPGRIVVFLTVLLLARWMIAFPRRSRYENLPDFVRRLPSGPRAGLFAAIALLGTLVALGGNTPYYRFLFQSLGSVMHAIRVPARGIVLFHVGLAVLSAWGLSLLARRRAGWKRGAWIAGALLLTAFEYRAFPVPVLPVEGTAAPVYRWLATVRPGGGIAEWPFGGDYEIEYEFRSTEHWHPLLNGYSGFRPPHYHELWGLLQQKPIPDAAWEKIRDLGGSLIVLHRHAAAGLWATPEFDRAARRWTREGKLKLLASFPHERERDYVFRMTTSAPFDARLPAEARLRAEEQLARDARRAETEFSPPFGVIDSPREKASVSAGDWGYGWALDDSGIAEIRVSAGGAPTARAAIGQLHPGVSAVHPEFPGADRAGFGFAVPALPPGKHTLVLTLVAKDGGEAKLTRVVRVR